MENSIFYHSSVDRNDALGLPNFDQNVNAVQPQNQQYQFRGLGGMTLENVERCAIFETLLSVRGNRTQAAKNLRVSLKTIYNKIQRYQLSNYDFSQSQVSQKPQDQLD